MTREPDGAQVLADLPPALWAPLLAAVRRAADRLGRPALPAGLVPYAGFHPSRLAADRPRQAVAAALAGDPRLREAVGEVLDERLWAAAEVADVARLVAAHGDAPAVAALAARGRWADVAVVAAESARGEASRGRAAADAPVPVDRAAVRAADVAAARRDRDAAVRRADAAERRVRALEELAAARQETAEAREEASGLRERLDDELRHGRDRLARLRRRADAADARARVEADRAEAVAERLTTLAAELRDGGATSSPRSARLPASGGDAPPDAAAGRVAARARRAPATPAVPRDVAPAEPGRPCRLPPGVAGDTSAAVTALLRVVGLELVVDGYNVSKDVRGRPMADLTDQREWLERLVAGLVARHPRRATVVFDGEGDRTVATARGRGVRVVYTAAGETADERIAGIVAALDAATPVAVVTSDREVRDACEALGANVVAAGVFLEAAD